MVSARASETVTSSSLEAKRVSGQNYYCGDGVLPVGPPANHSARPRNNETIIRLLFRLRNSRRVPPSPQFRRTRNDKKNADKGVPDTVFYIRICFSHT